MKSKVFRMPSSAQSRLLLNLHNTRAFRAFPAILRGIAAPPSPAQPEGVSIRVARAPSALIIPHMAAQNKPNCHFASKGKFPK
jgi:hypothetical protein